MTVLLKCALTSTLVISIVANCFLMSFDSALVQGTVSQVLFTNSMLIMGYGVAKEPQTPGYVGYVE